MMLVTLGETMVLLEAPELGPLRRQRHLRVGIGGAESNVAVAARRLGAEAAWIGRVGDDEFGEMILGFLRAEGVDVASAVRDPDVQTSLMVKERRTTALTRVVYYRRDGPGSRLRPADVPEQVIRRAAVLHVTGITPALSPSARATVHEAIAVARASRVAVSLDYNYRAALWSADEAARELADLTRAADVVSASRDEAALVVAADVPERIVAALATRGPRAVVLKLGAEGCVALVDGELHTVRAVPVTAVDHVGAGDAFVGGYLAEMLAGAPPAARLATAAACGAYAVTVPGDCEGLPTRRDLMHLAAAVGTVAR